MKKTLVLLVAALTMLIAILSPVSFSEGGLSLEDFSFMVEGSSLEDLIMFRDYLDALIISNGGDTVSSSDSSDGEAFAEGIYEAGKTIKPGVYNLSFSNMDFGAIIKVYDSKETFDNGKPRENYVAHSDTANYNIALDDGNILSIMLASGRGDIRISQAKASWMP